MGARRVVLIVVMVASLTLVMSAVAERGSSPHGRVLAANPGGLAVPAGFGDVVVFGTNSVHIFKNAHVTGDVVANDFSAGPTLVPGFELVIDREGAVTGKVEGDSVKLDRDVAISGTVSYNDLTTSTGVTTGGLVTPLSLPVFASPPAFQVADVRPDAVDVMVGDGQTVTLAAGSYRDISIAQRGTLVLSGGTYDVRSIVEVTTVGGPCNFPCRSIGFSGATSLRIEGRFTSGKNSYVGPATGSGLAAHDAVVYVGGTNGGDGTPTALPPAALVGQASVVAANFYVANGTMALDKVSAASGAFLGRDVSIDAAGAVTLDTAFRNQAPTADPQSVSTNGAGSITITLTGSDPEGDDLTFAIVTGPTHGMLGPVMEDPAPFPGDPPGCNPATTDPCDPPDPPRTSATVDYTPDTADDLEDSFVFKVTDTAGNTGMATVHINPPGDPTPPPEPVTTVVVNDVATETANDIAVVVPLFGDAPAGTDLTFSIVPGTGPAHGTLSAVTQGSETPQRTATVIYTPTGTDFGPESFQFKACGFIGETEVCATATATVTVIVAQAQADPQEVTTPAETAVEITLTGSPGLPNGGGSAAASGLRTVVGHAAFLDGAEIAGNVADANGDGFGDNHNALPGSTPGLMSAGVDLTGGPGSNGVVRMEIEWDISSFGPATQLESAQVILNTNKGTIDSLDTFFFVGTGSQDGLLTDSDFEAPAVEIPAVTMPAGTDEPGTMGTFTFDVTQELAQALSSDLSFFSISGRVDEGLAGGGAQRGLQVYTTASGNLPSSLEPQLAIATPGVTAPLLTFSILTLPVGGTLLDVFAVPITTVPTTLTDNRVTYRPNEAFSGGDSFTFQVDDATTGTFATAVITLVVGSSNCNGGIDEDGRPCP